MMMLNGARLASYQVAATAVLLCAAVISLKIYQTPPSPNVAHIAPSVPAQSATDGGWSLAAPVSTRITVSQPRSHLSTHRTATPPRYVLESMPVSYESSLRFYLSPDSGSGREIRDALAFSPHFCRRPVGVGRRSIGLQRRSRGQRYFRSLQEGGSE